MFKVGDRVRVLSEKESNVTNWSSLQLSFIGKIGTIADEDDGTSVHYVKFDNDTSCFSVEKLQLVEEMTPKFKVGDKVKLITSNEICSIYTIDGRHRGEQLYTIKPLESSTGFFSLNILESNIELVEMKEKQDLNLKVKVPVDGILMHYSDNKYFKKKEETTTENVSLNKEQDIYSNLFIAFNPHSYRLGLSCNE
ncbi:MAG: hypothetical protein HKO92_06535 [Flavobacteriaceae bacterium]|nr:hypothetical protein [Flavobacteriaceae bacterium]